MKLDLIFININVARAIKTIPINTHTTYNIVFSDICSMVK